VFTEEQVIAAAKKAAGNENTVIFEMQGHDDPMQLLDYVRHGCYCVRCRVYLH
jgi:hypothetical protein